jgi:hypothetical protein
MEEEVEIEEEVKREVAEILRLGQENTLEHDEAVRMMTTIITQLQIGARRRGKPVAELEGDPKTLAEQIIDRNRIWQVKP